MKAMIISTCLALSATYAMAAVAAESVDAATGDKSAYVKDSVITTKVKSKLAAKHMSTLTKIKVETDRSGMVWLSGTAPTKDASDLAAMIAKQTDGVTSVHNSIIVTE